MWKTSITESFGIELPFVSAGMGFVALPPLVAAVSEAGALGLLAAAATPPSVLREMIADVRRQTTRPFGVNLLVEQTALGPLATDEHVDVCIEERVPLVVFFWHFPPASWLRRLEAASIPAWIQVGSLDAVEEALGLGMDAVIVQGAEAGGHNRSTHGLMSLLPNAVDLAGDTPVLAAGGIADGRGVAAALALGAAAVCVGTRLVASREAHAHEEYKRRIAAAALDDVVTTRLFGVEWPDQPMRVLRNRVVSQWPGSEQTTPPAPPGSEPIGTTLLMGQPYAMPRFSAILPTVETSGDLEEMCLAAGESAALVRSIEPAATIVQGMMADAHLVLERLRAGSETGASSAGHVR